MDNKSLKLSLFFCSNSINSNELLKSTLLHKNTEIKMISLPCSGRINIQYFLKAIESGTDGVILLTCPWGECQYVEGNLRAEKRVSAVNSILKEAGIENERIITIQPNEKNNTNDIHEKIKNFADSIINIQKAGKVTV